jgi:hypothetical protein
MGFDMTHAQLLGKLRRLMNRLAEVTQGVFRVVQKEGLTLVPSGDHRISSTAD